MQVIAKHRHLCKAKAPAFALQRYTHLTIYLTCLHFNSISHTLILPEILPLGFQLPSPLPLHQNLDNLKLEVAARFPNCFCTVQRNWQHKLFCYIVTDCYFCSLSRETLHTSPPYFICMGNDPISPFPIHEICWVETGEIVSPYDKEHVGLEEESLCY